MIVELDLYRATKTTNEILFGILKLIIFDIINKFLIYIKTLLFIIHFHYHLFWNNQTIRLNSQISLFELITPFSHLFQSSLSPFLLKKKKTSFAPFPNIKNPKEWQTLSNNKTFLPRASIIPLHLIKKKKSKSETRHKEGLNTRDDLAYAKEWRNFFNRAVIARLRRRAISAKVPWKLALSYRHSSRKDAAI